MQSSTNQSAMGRKAALLMMGGMLIIGYIDNFVIVIAQDVSLWQFHATRSLIIALTFCGLGLLGFVDFRPKKIGAVLGRGAFFSASMIIYFGSLAFLPISIVVAGLFTSPILVMIITVLVLRQRVGPVRWFAAGLGFVGILFVINPSGDDFTLLSLLPLVAAFFYAVSAIATRQWCEGETTSALLFWFFVVMGVASAVVLVVLTLFPIDAPEGAAGFIARGFVWPGQVAWFWIFVQAFVSMVAVGMITRAYQIGEASYVAVFEYSLMIFAPLWAWVIWQENPTFTTIVGIALIMAAGSFIAWRSGRVGQEV